MTTASAEEKNYSETVETAREYYNSDDADNFYFNVWGGEDIHVGLYASDDEPIFDASRRTVEHMVDKLEADLNENTKVLDIGAGYGGAARYLAKTYGCPVVALNLSEVENERDREMNRQQGLDHLIDVVDDSFEKLPFDDESFEVVWCQDSILHSNNREAVLKEVNRVLKPGGEFVFTDPMQADDCPAGVLDPILARLHLESLAAPGWYVETAKKLGMQQADFEPHHHQLTRHYGRVLQELERRDAELEGIVSQAYRERMKEGLRHWVNGGNQGYLAWGFFHFKK